MNKLRPLAIAVFAFLACNPLPAQTVDASFNPNANGSVLALSIQPDGKSLVGGNFTIIGGQQRTHIARLNANGLLDISFRPSVNASVYSFVTQPDGKILIGGQFTKVNGQERKHIARLHPDGSLDASFNPNANGWINSLALQADGKILLGGQFSTVGGQTRNHIARVHADGSLDASFNPNADGWVYAIATQSDGRILLGGTFMMIGGQQRVSLARLHADGSLDESFNQSVSFTVYAVCVQPDGKALVGGAFNTVGVIPRGNIARLHPDGSLDTSFDPDAGGTVFSLVLQADGKILLGGNFTTIGGQLRNRIARIHADGSLDPAFNPDVANPIVNSVALQSDGKILVGGNFSAIGGQPRSSIARLLNDPASSSLVVTGTVQIDWLRSGSSPEVERVTFENWNGSEWASAGVAARVPGGWRAEGLSLPSSSWIRAIGAATGGQYNGSSGMIGEIVAYGGGPAPGIEVTENGGPPLVSGVSILDFEEAGWQPNSISRTLTIKNTGSAPLDNLALQITGEAAGGFLVDELESPTLAPGGETSFTIRCSPSWDGIGGAVISIQSNQPDASPFGIQLEASGNRLDSSFNPSANNRPSCIAIQPDQRILIGGGFTTIGGQVRNRIARFRPNGIPDGSFDPDANGAVSSITLQPDGKVLIGGSFTAVSGQTRNRMARLHPNGTLDESFNPNVSGAVLTSVLQPNGQIIIGGEIINVGGQTRSRIARLNQDGSLDPSFIPNIGGTAITLQVSCLALQPDGKILVGGNFNTLNGQTRMRIARLHPDGSLDESFVPASNVTISSMMLQPDGKILLGGVSGLVRILSDGSIDDTFSANLTETVSSLALQADGRIIVGGSFTAIGNQVRSRIARLHSDGSLDPTFEQNANNTVDCLALENDGKILLGGSFSTIGGQPRVGIGRLLNDPAVSTIVQTGNHQIDWLRGGAAPEIERVAFDYWLNGVWSSSSPAVWVPGGWRASGLTLPPNIWIRARGVTSSGRGINYGMVQQVVNYNGPQVPEISATGEGGVPIVFGQSTLDFGEVPMQESSAPQTITVYNTGSSPLLGLSFQLAGKAVGEFSVEPQGIASIPAGQSARFKIRFSPTIPYQRNGALSILINHPQASPLEIGLTGFGIKTDMTFVPNANDSVRAFGLQPDGKIIVGGLFTTIDGQARNRIARLHPDGSLDPTFNPGAGANDRINSIAIQADGKILVSGWFTSLGGQTRNGIARLHPDGSLDESFNPDANGWVNSVAIQPDGMLLIVGRFTTVTGQPRNRIARLFSDGSLDVSFNPVAGGAVHTVAFLPDGKIIVAGEFTTIGGLTRNRIALLNTDGSVDSTFNPNANNIVRCLALQPDGKVVIAGDFTTVSGFTRNRIARINANGSPDHTFSGSFANSVHSLALQADGRILVGSVVSSPGGITRLNTNGSIDTSLDHVANQSVYTLMLQANGRILAGGDFTTIDGLPRGRIARLLTYAATSELSVTGGDQIHWLRDGTAPEVNHVLFDYWNGNTWVSAGNPVRITGGWQASGLALPTDSWIRARGIARGGYLTGSTSIIEQVAFSGTEETFASWISYPAWNLSGASADPQADPDGDGTPNLLEYALGSTDPTDRASAFPVIASPQLPPPDPQLRITFLRRRGGIETGDVYSNGDLIYRPVASTDLDQWNLAPIPAANPPGLPHAPEGFEWTSYAMPDVPEISNRGFLKLKVAVE